jgi:hypothetical protein
MKINRWLAKMFSFALAAIAISSASAYQLQYAPLYTPWAQLVNTNAPLPEYPRPQMVRSNWMNLNALWQFQPGASNDAPPFNQTLSGEILVPYPMESAISGVAAYHAWSWYRRTFSVPSAWSGQHVLLHLDAVNWLSHIYVNGQSVGTHQGGYDPITFDITPYLNGGTNELLIQVYSPEDSLGEPRGKQTLSPGGIMYTSSSGIWQPAWLEPVPATSITTLMLVPDIDNQLLNVTVGATGVTGGTKVNATAMAGTNIIATVTNGIPGTRFTLAIPNPNLWSPTNPYLYNLTVSLKNGAATVDSVNSYFGMRKISLSTNNNQVRIMLNNQFVFQYGPLDQGFWPDGIYTAPTDSALKSDIEQEKLFGFNMVRKHIKVERQRWYYYADTLGILVWQDMPSCNSYTGNPNPPPVDPTDYSNELTALVTNHWNSPAIVMWTTFNEDQGEAGSGNGVGQASTASLVQLVKNLDPSRLVNQASGGAYFGVGDIYDNHSYPAPGDPTSTSQAVVDGEFGGVALEITNHIWVNGGGEGSASSTNDLASQFETFCGELSSDVQNDGLSGAIYTQTTDVEDELNGLLTYDREIRKPDPRRIQAAILAASQPLVENTVVPTSQSSGIAWQYTTNYTTNTIPANWYATGFNASSWSSGPAGFGAGNPPNTGGLVRTAWSTSDIWLRRTFNPGILTANEISNLNFYIYHDEDVELYINGVFAGSAPSYTSSYVLLPMNAAGQSALLSNASNLIAVHVHQTTGGQFIDVGIVTHTNITLLLPPVPAIPTNLIAASGQLGISLGWDSAANAINYSVQRALVSGGPYTNIITAPLNCCLDNAVSNGVTYYYVVSSINAAGQSSNSAEIAVTTPPPVILGPPQLVTWFKADALHLSNRAVVANWPDSSGNGDNATQTNSGQMPEFVTATINGLPVVRFTSSSQTYMAFPRPVSGDFTITCVFESTQGLDTGTLYYQGAGLVNGEVSGVTDDFGTCLFANGSIAAGTGAPDVAVDSAMGFNDGHPHIFTFTRQRSNGLISLYVDGVLAGTTNGGLETLTAPAQLVLGAQQTLGNYLTGDIAEVKIYNAVLSDSDRAADLNSLECKYGLGSGAPPSAPAGLSAAATNRQVTVTWDPVVGANSYNLLSATNSAGPFAMLASGLTTNSYVDSAAVNQENNYYEVAAVSSCATSTNSAAAEVFVGLPTLGASIQGGILSLTWPAQNSGWVLYSATNLTPPITWLPVTNLMTSNNGNYNLLLPATNGPQEFFRLIAP